MKRIITSLVLMPVIVCVILWVPLWFFLGVLSVIAVLCYREYRGLVAGHGIEPQGVEWYLVGLALLVSPSVPLAVTTLLAMAALTLGLRSSDMKTVLPSAAAVLLGIAYVFGGWRCAVGLRAINPYWLLFAVGMCWVGDTTAFCAGKLFGRRRLAPVISPGKSWEGAIASLVASLVLGSVYLAIFVPSSPWWLRLAAAAASNIGGQAGDLAESALKRGAGMKDSGTMLPGHGGWLDRIDSTLFSVPLVYGLLLALG